MQSLESATTWELETLASKCSRADGSLLTDLELAAILRGIAAELSDRAAARKSGHMQATETDRLQALIEDKEAELLISEYYLRWLWKKPPRASRRQRGQAGGQMPVVAMAFRLGDMERKLLRLALSPPRREARSRPPR